MNESLSAIESATIADQQPIEAHLRQRNAELEARVEQLLASNKLLEAFGYTVAHDLQAPLRWIDDATSVLWKQYAANFPSPAQEHLHSVRANVKAMSQLIDDLLRFARLGHQSLRRRPVDMQLLVSSLLDRLLVDHVRRQMTTVIGELPPCDADEGLLRQVWFNLLSNALKFTQRCTLARIEIGSERQGDDVVYFVRDNGVGFDMSCVNKLFMPFKRLHSDEEFKGTGIGLATVRRIIEYHGGRVWVEAKPQAGATFYFTLSSAESHA